MVKKKSTRKCNSKTISFRIAMKIHLKKKIEKTEQKICRTYMMKILT